MVIVKVHQFNVFIKQQQKKHNPFHKVYLFSNVLSFAKLKIEARNSENNYICTSDNFQHSFS